MVRAAASYGVVFSSLMAIAFMHLDERGAVFTFVVIASVLAAIREVAP